MTRVPTGFAHYRGDIRSSIDENRAYGPDYNGEAHWPVEVSYDEATDLTRVGFSKTPPPAVVDAMAELGVNA